MTILLYLFLFLVRRQIFQGQRYEHFEFFRYCQSGLKKCMEEDSKATCTGFKCGFSLLPPEEVYIIIVCVC